MNDEQPTAIPILSNYSKIQRLIKSLLTSDPFRSWQSVTPRDISNVRVAEVAGTWQVSMKDVTEFLASGEYTPPGNWIVVYEPSLRLVNTAYNPAALHAALTETIPAEITVPTPEPDPQDAPIRKKRREHTHPMDYVSRKLNVSFSAQAAEALAEMFTDLEPMNKNMIVNRALLTYAALLDLADSHGKVAVYAQDGTKILVIL